MGNQTTSEAVPVIDAKSVAIFLGLQYTEEQLTAFGRPPKPRDGFVTFFDAGLSLLRLREALRGNDNGTIFYKHSWYDSEEFAMKDGKPCYRQLRIEAVKDSFGKTFATQQTLLLPDEEVPMAHALIMGMVIHFLATGHRLFPTYWVRCIDHDSAGDRLYVGRFDVLGIDVVCGWGGGRNPDIGLAAAGKSKP